MSEEETYAAMTVLGVLTCMRSGMSSELDSVLDADAEHLKSALVCCAAWLEASTQALMEAWGQSADDVESFFQGLSIRYQSKEV